MERELGAQKPVQHLTISRPELQLENSKWRLDLDHDKTCICSYLSFSSWESCKLGVQVSQQLQSSGGFCFEVQQQVLSVLLAIECIMQGTSAKHKRKVAPSLHPPFHTSVINTSLISETCAALKIEMLPEKHTDHAVHSRFGLRQRTLCVYLSQRSHFTQTHAYLSTAH